MLYNHGRSLYACLTVRCSAKWHDLSKKQFGDNTLHTRKYYATFPKDSWLVWLAEFALQIREKYMISHIYKNIDGQYNRHHFENYYWMHLPVQHELRNRPKCTCMFDLIKYFSTTRWPVAGGLPSQRTSESELSVLFFDVRLNKLLNKQSRDGWTEMHWRSFDVNANYNCHPSATVAMPASETSYARPHQTQTKTGLSRDTIALGYCREFLNFTDEWSVVVGFHVIAKSVTQCCIGKIYIRKQSKFPLQMSKGNTVQRMVTLDRPSPRSKSASIFTNFKVILDHRK